MNKLLKYSLVLFAFILMSATSFISLEVLMDKFNRTYDKEIISMDINVKAIESISNNEITLEKSTVMITKKSFYQNKKKSETFIDKDYEINIDNKLKTITVSNSGGLNNKKARNYSMDSLAKTMSDQLGATVSENSNDYSVNFSIDHYKAEYLINKSDYTLKKVKYKFNEGYAYSSMNITYSNYRFDKQAKHKVKKASNFIKLKKGIPFASRNYSNYSVNNQLN